MIQNNDGVNDLISLLMRFGFLIHTFLNVFSF